MLCLRCANDLAVHENPTPPKAIAYDVGCRIKVTEQHPAPSHLGFCWVGIVGISAIPTLVEGSAFWVHGGRTQDLGNITPRVHS